MLLLYILSDDWPIFMISASNELLQQQLEYTLLNPDCHSWWISKMQSYTLEERYAIKKMPQKCMECFRLVLPHLAWIEHQFLSGIRDSRKAGSLWWMMRGMGGVRKSIHESWLAKQLGLVLLCWGSSGRDSVGRVHNSILVTDYLSKMGINTIPQPPFSPDLAPCDFWLFPKLRGCRRYETIEEIKEGETKVIDTLTQEDFHGAFQKFLERYNKCIAAGGDYFGGD